MKNKNKIPLWEDFIEIGSLIKLEGVKGIFLIYRIDNSQKKAFAFQWRGKQISQEVPLCYLDTTPLRAFRIAKKCFFVMMPQKLTHVIPFSEREKRFSLWTNEKRP